MFDFFVEKYRYFFIEIFVLDVFNVGEVFNNLLVGKNKISIKLLLVVKYWGW